MSAALVAFGAAAGVIGLLASGRKEGGKLDPHDDALIEMHTGPDAISPSASGPASMGSDASGGVTQVAHDGLGATLTNTTSSPAPSAAPSAALGGELAPASSTGAGSSSGIVPDGTGGTKPCATCDANALAGKALYTTLIGDVQGLTSTDQARVLSSVGSKSGAIW